MAEKAETCINLVFWFDGFKLNHETKAVIIQQLNNKWLTQKVTFGKNKKIFDKEMQEISQAIIIAEQTC